MTEPPLNFDTAIDRHNWIIQNADYFTTCRLFNRRYERTEHPDLETARSHAKELLKGNDSKPVMIYAVTGSSDTFVGMVQHKE
jgi:hypothetical protein